MTEFARTDRNLTENFKQSEFLCKHCQRAGIQPDFVTLLQRLRNALSRPILINSGYRCMAHPVERVKPPGTFSAHTYGIASDITVPGVGLKELYNAILRFPEFKGIGVSPWENYIHLDTRAKVARWTYSRMAKVVPWSGKWEDLAESSGYKVE